MTPQKRSNRDEAHGQLNSKMMYGDKSVCQSTLEKAVKLECIDSVCEWVILDNCSIHVEVDFTFCC